MESGNIGKGSVCQSVRPRPFLHDGLMAFIHIGYHDQVPLATHACKIEFGSVPNLSNYAYVFINIYCCDVSEKNVVILFIFGTVIRYHALLILYNSICLCTKFE